MRRHEMNEAIRIWLLRSDSRRRAAAWDRRVGRQLHMPTELFTERRRRNRGKRVLGIRLALRSTQVRGHYELGARFSERSQRGHRCHDAADR